MGHLEGLRARNTGFENGLICSWIREGAKATAGQGGRIPQPACPPCGLLLPCSDGD